VAHLAGQHKQDMYVCTSSSFAGLQVCRLILSGSDTGFEWEQAMLPTSLGEADSSSTRAVKPLEGQACILRSQSAPGSSTDCMCLLVLLRVCNCRA